MRPEFAIRQWVHKCRQMDLAKSEIDFKICHTNKKLGRCHAARWFPYFAEYQSKCSGLHCKSPEPKLIAISADLIRDNTELLTNFL
ncbi:Hypothetical predicted protein [Octopus vulgaris]|uniref:Uncharacterized protein n=1 Tax=Octopus vulgaris TaxID=6645 RepID=A0AA36AKW9_OCTVU|nr:Hypothetical predicted protein [Octopus vulgaris]